MPQTSVGFKTGFGVPGELFDNGPVRAQAYIINTTDPTLNVFGRACTIADTTGETVRVGGAGTFAGILANPKTAVSNGTAAGGPFAPTLTVPNYRVVEVVSMGSIIVTLVSPTPAFAYIGWYVSYDTTTGELIAATPETAVPSGYAPAYAFVDRYEAALGGFAVITLQPSLVYNLGP